MAIDIEQRAELIKGLRDQIDLLINDIPLDRLDEATREKLREQLKGQVKGKIREGLDERSRRELDELLGEEPSGAIRKPKPARAKSAKSATTTFADCVPPSLIEGLVENEGYIFLNEGVVEGIQSEINALMRDGETRWTRPSEWTREQKTVSTIEERLQKLKSRGIKIDIGKQEALRILQDKGYHVLKEYAKPFVIWREQEGKDYYIKGTPFSLLHALYYADYEIRGVLFDAIAHIEANLRNTLDFVCSQGRRHHLWYLDNNVVRYRKEGSRQDSRQDGFTYKMLPTTQKTIAGLVRRRETERKVRFKTPHGLPYAYEVLRNMHLGELVCIYRALKNEDYRIKIAQQYGLSVRAFIEMLMVMKDLRNAVAHNECLFLNSYGYIKPGEALFTTLGAENPVLIANRVRKTAQVRNGEKSGVGTLADAMLAVQYFLSRISLGEGRIRTMRESLREIFAHYTSDRQYPDLKEVFLYYYAYTVYMVKTAEDLDNLAMRRGYHKDILRTLMGFKPIRQRKSRKQA